MLEPRFPQPCESAGLSFPSRFKWKCRGYLHHGHIANSGSGWLRDRLLARDQNEGPAAICSGCRRRGIDFAEIPRFCRGRADDRKRFGDCRRYRCQQYLQRQYERDHRLLNLVLTSTVTKTGVNLASNVQFSATVPVVFMKVLGFQTLTVSGYSKASASLPPYLDFYLTLDVSGSMGLPSTPSEAVRMQSINPDNFVQYPTGCTLACHFAPLKSACIDPPVTAPTAPPANPPTTTTSYSQQYNTNNACMGYAYSRVSQTALSNPDHQAVDYPVSEAGSRLAGSDAFRPAGFAQHGS